MAKDYTALLNSIKFSRVMGQRTVDERLSDLVAKSLDEALRQTGHSCIDNVVADLAIRIAVKEVTDEFGD